MANAQISGRRYDLDWIRVLAFGILILYHVGMIYVPWGFHVKSAYIFESLQAPMVLSNLFRLLLLFVISGIATRYIADKMTVGAYVKSRHIRLLLPLVFGTVVIVAPQAYVEAVSKGLIAPGYFDFWPVHYLSFTWVDGMQAPFPTYNHLWYVLYLFFYAMIIAPFLPAMTKFADSKQGQWLTSGWRLILLPIIFLAFNLVVIESAYPESHDLTNDWGAHSRYGFLFLWGFLMCKNTAAWDTIKANLNWMVAAVGLGAIYIVAAMSGALEGLVGDNGYAVWVSLTTIYRWAIILMIFGLGMKYLNRPSKALTYLTEAVYPYYIVHQTIILVGYYLLADFALGGVFEPLIMITITFGGCYLAHEYVIRRVGVLRPLFGLKPLQSK